MVTVCTVLSLRLHCWLCMQQSSKNMYEFVPLLCISQWYTYKSAVAQSFVSVAEADTSWYGPWHCQHEAPPLLPPQKLIVKGQLPSLDQCSSVWHHCSDSPLLSPLTSLSRPWSLSLSFKLFSLVYWVSSCQELEHVLHAYFFLSTTQCIPIHKGVFESVVSVSWVILWRHSPCMCSFCVCVFVCHVARDCASLLPWVQETTSSCLDHLAGQSLSVNVC